MPKPATWDVHLRRQLKLEHGQGWSLSEQSGKVKLTRRHRDGARSSVMLDLSWAPSSASQIASAVSRVRSLMDERNLSLMEAHQLSFGLGASRHEPKEPGDVSWDAVAEAFLSTRADRRATTLGDLRHRLHLALQTLSNKPKPRDGRSLMRAYAKQHFAHCPAGGQGRKRHLGDIGAFLTFAVDRCGAEACWRPLQGQELQELIGTADRRTDETLTPPIKPEQLASLLDDLERDKRQDLWLAVALVGLYGLRPAELAALRGREGRLYVAGAVKRNRQSMTQINKERLVLPLDLPGREGEGDRAAQLYLSGEVDLPLSIRTAIAKGDFKPVGDAFRQLLDRYGSWQRLVNSTPGLTPYSLRHGWAWRAHKAYTRPLSTRDAAALMGHTPATHHKHYGRWTDEQGLLEAVAGLKGDQQQSRDAGSQGMVASA